MKATLALLTFVFSAQTWAGVNPCLTQIFDSLQLGSEAQRECVLKDKQVAESVAMLCSKNGKKVSGEYTTYQKYSAEYSELLQKSKAVPIMPNERDAIYSKMRSVANDWSVFGFRQEIEIRLMIITSVARASCAGH